MPVRIKDILNLNSFQTARVIAGEKYFDNIIKQVSIADAPITELDYEVSKRGDFYLSGFYFAKDNLSDMYANLNVLIETGASGICLLDEYINDLPEDIKTFCDESNLPVLMVDKNVPYADMIKEIMELVILDQRHELLSNQVRLLISGNLNGNTMEAIIKGFNVHFQNNISAIYIMTESGSDLPNNNMIIDMFNSGALSFGAAFDGGVLGLVSYSKRSKGQIKEIIEYYLQKIITVIPEAYIGISSLGSSMDKCDISIKQAITSAEAGRNHIIKKRVTYYDDLGVLKLLLLMAGRQEFDDFIDEIIAPVINYDKTHRTNLFETMSIFLSYEKDPKKTARAMYIHPNTVRYRVERTRELIAVEQSMDSFLESFSIALKLYKISPK